MGEGEITGAPPPSSSTRRWQRTGSSKTGNGLGPWQAWKRDTRAQPRGAADSKQTEAGRQTEKGTNKVQPRKANTMEWGWCVGGVAHTPPRGAWLKATHGGVGEAQVSHQGPPQDVTTRCLPAQGPSHSTPGTRDWCPPAPSQVLTPTNTTHPRATSLPGRTVSLPAPAAPMSPPTQGSPRTTLPQGHHWPTEAGGQHPHEARPAQPQTGKGSTGWSHVRDEEKRPAVVGRGQQTCTVGAVGQGCRHHPGTTKTQGTQPGHQENQQGVPPPPTHKGSPTTCLGHGPVPASPRAGPHNPAPAARAAKLPKPTFHHPSSTDSFSI